MADWKEVKLTKGEEGLTSEFPDYEVVEHRIGNQTDTIENSNKFFSLELHKSTNGKWRVYSNYGRVDGNEFTGVVGVYGPATESEMRTFFDSKFKSKVRPSKGYQEIKFIKAKVGSPKARLCTKAINESEIPDEKRKKLEDESTKKKSGTVKKIDLHPTTEKLINQWYKETTRTIEGNSAVTITSEGLTTPLGVLTFAQIDKGRNSLKELTEAVKNKDTKEIKKLTGDFYSHIPTKLGRKIEDSDLINSDSRILEKFDLLDMMTNALEVGGETFVGNDTHKKYFDLESELVYLDPKDPEFIRLTKKVKETRGANHYNTTDKVRNILRVTSKADSTRYANCLVNNEHELWHGSRNCNIASLIKRGLLITPPGAPISGAMFAPGIYLAAQSTKSINYSLYDFPGMGRVDNCFLFAVKAKLGKQLKLNSFDYSADKKCRNGGYDSTWGVKGVSLIHDEYITYSLEQTRLAYIIELER